MAQDKVTRKELEEMRVGTTRIFSLSEPGKLQAAAVTCNQLKKERRGKYECKKDYESMSVSITRIG